jgi:hypothetical protein
MLAMENLIIAIFRQPEADTIFAWMTQPGVGGTVPNKALTIFDGSYPNSTLMARLDFARGTAAEDHGNTVYGTWVQMMPGLFDPELHLLSGEHNRDLKSLGNWLETIIGASFAVVTGGLDLPGVLAVHPQAAINHMSDFWYYLQEEKMHRPYIIRTNQQWVAPQAVPPRPASAPPAPPPPPAAPFVKPPPPPPPQPSQAAAADPPQAAHTCADQGQPSIEPPVFSIDAGFCGCGNPCGFQPLGYGCHICGQAICYQRCSLSCNHCFYIFCPDCLDEHTQIVSPLVGHIEVLDQEQKMD